MEPVREILVDYIEWPQEAQSAYETAGKLLVQVNLVMCLE